MTPVSGLLAFWQLGSGWMLLWGLAAALPILIHLWSRRRYRKVTWAAMQFLLAAMRKNSRRILLEQWLLLAVRTLILLLLALALADPALSLLQSWTGAPASGQTHVVLVIDGSYSMDYRSADKPRFDAAKEMARQMVSAAAQGDGFTLVLMSEPPKVVIGEPAFDVQDVLEEIDSLAMTHTGASLPATLAEVETILRAAAKQHPRLASGRVCFFSDLGRTTWGEVTTADCRERLARLSELASLSLVDLGQPGEQNWAITRLEANQSLVTIGGETIFQAEIQSFSGEALPRQVVELHVDGQQVAEQRVDIAAAGRSTAAFSYRFATPGEHIVEVRLADDRLPADNRRALSVPVRESIRVLVIDGRPGEGKHVALALDPEQSDRRRIRVSRAAESALLETELAQYDCVVLCNVGRFNRDEAAVLASYVQSGGGLITFLGDQVQADSYNRELAGSETSAHVLPAKLESLARESRYRFDPLGYEHPIVAPFRGFEGSGLLTTPVWRYFKLAPHENAKTALAFDGGDAAIVEEKIGRGRSVLFASAASNASVDRSTTPPTPWTAISSWPSFPPLVHEMLNLAMTGRAEGRNLQVGDELTASVPGATTDTPLSLVGPDGRSERIPLVFTSGLPQWSYGGAALSGPFEARIGPPVSSSQRFALQLNPRESDLERLPAEMLPSHFRSSAPAAAEALPQLGPVPARSYFRLLLSLVLGLVLAETVLAWLIGRGSA